MTPRFPTKTYKCDSYGDYKQQRMTLRNKLLLI